MTLTADRQKTPNFPDQMANGWERFSHTWAIAVQPQVILKEQK